MNRHELETLTIEATDLIGGFFDQLGVTDQEALKVLVSIIGAQAVVSCASRELFLLAIGNAFDDALLVNELSDTPDIH